MTRKKTAGKSRPRKRDTRSHEEVRELTFARRSRQMYSNHRRHAREAGAWLDYDQEGLRRLLRRSLESGTCPYCQGRLDEGNFSCDHRVPVSRAGGHSITNLIVCCINCNLAKGPLDTVEWRQLCNAMADWSEPVRRHTLARLRAGGGRMRSGVNQVPPRRRPTAHPQPTGASEPCPTPSTAGPTAAKSSPTTDPTSFTLSATGTDPCGPCP